MKIVQKAVTDSLVLEFEVAFPNETALSPTEYLKGGKISVILNAAAFFLGFKSNNSKYINNKILLQTIFGKQNIQFASQVYSKISSIEENGTQVTIIQPYSSLKLFEYFFNKVDQQEETQSESEFEINLFKAYLALNSEFTLKQKKAFESTADLDTDLHLSMMMFCMYYPVSDKVNYDIRQIWATQSIKAIYFFKFLEKHPKLQYLLNEFLNRFKVSSWEEYLKRLVALTSSAIQNEKEAHTDIVVNQGEKFQEGCSFIEKLVVSEKDELEHYDFITLRAKPFYRIKQGLYRVIFNLFVVEKIFKGMYFLLRDINDSLPAEKKVSGLKSIYGYDFSEQTLLYTILEIIYTHKCVRFSGRQLSDVKIQGAPDYYIRKNKNVLIFESKDFLIRADKKTSFDFSIYEEEIGKTLYYDTLENGKEKAGAVMQIIGTIRKVLRKEFKVDTDYLYRDVFIYPIVITHDHQYDTIGFNNLVNYWFQAEIQILKEEGFFINHIKPIVVINIDTLIYYQVNLSEDILLHDLINKYVEDLKPLPKEKFKTFDDYKDYRISKLVPFSLFVERYFYKLGIEKLPPILDVVGKALFDETDM